LLPYNIVGERKLERLMALAARTQLSVTTDSAAVARGLSDAARRAGLSLTVLVECDTGAHRCGVQSPHEAAELARAVAGLPGLRFGGLMTYPTSQSLDDFVRETRALLKHDKIHIERVSGGGTPCMWEVHTHPELTEHRAGIYVYGDRLTMRSGAVTLDTCALTVHTTVVSRPTPERGILDAGSKSLSMDLHGLDGYGYICEYPEAKIYALSEEHAHVDFSAYERRPEIGERLTVIPNHCCVVTNLFDEVIGARGDQVQATWKVAARGTVT
jgi:D-serine deaminase-like pyridoxal phosphate-dependent protein